MTQRDGTRNAAQQTLCCLMMRAWSADCTLSQSRTIDLHASLLSNRATQFSSLFSDTAVELRWKKTFLLLLFGVLRLVVHSDQLHQLEDCEGKRERRTLLFVIIA